jgi:hypothetical protein
MPQQEVFFQQETAEKQIAVLKTYDQQFAREAFESMDNAAQAQLWTALKVGESYDASDLPPVGALEAQEFLWEELVEAAREDGQLKSFFVVRGQTEHGISSLYVSPDWPSAESFAKGLLA